MLETPGIQLADLKDHGYALSEIGNGAQSMEEVARRIVAFVYERAVYEAGEGQRACPLVRLYKTHAYRDLPVALMDYVDSALGSAPPTLAMKCLTLLATAGDEPDWNHRSRSSGHQAIPLVSAEFLAGIPMVAQLVEQFGLDTGNLLTPDPTLILEMEQKRYRVFYVPDALGSPFIPAQDFVVRYGIRSVVGFGGMLPSGDLFAVILFSRAALSREAAEGFTSLALPVKIALLPFTFRHVFDPPETDG